MKKQKNPQYPDDGRAIANMNIDGMPWYIENKHMDMPKSVSQEEQLTRKETLHLIFNAVGAALLIASVFGLAGFLFIVFCQYVWLR